MASASSFLAALLLLLLPSYGLCATLNVCPSRCTYANISSAISHANANDVISVSPGDYTESNLVNLGIDLTIACNSSDSGACVVDAPKGWLNISAVLTLNGSFVISSNKTANGVMTLSSGGIWNQYGDITITATINAVGDATGVWFDGGTWNQTGTANIMVNASGGYSGTACVYFGDGGTWNQYGTANFMANASDGASAYGVFFGDGGTWNQTGTANIMVNASGEYAGAYGVLFGDGGTWNQTGTANIMVNASGEYSGAFGVLFGDGGTWNQTGTANIMVNASADAFGVFFDGTDVNQATWNQYGNVMATATVYAVYFEDCGTWNEYGTTNILPSAIYKNSSISCELVNVSPTSTPASTPTSTPTSTPASTPTNSTGGGGGTSSAETLVPHLSANIFSLLSLLMYER